MADILEEIIAWKRIEIERAKRQMPERALHAQVERIMVVADMDSQFDRLRRIVEKAEGRHDVTFFSMNPLPNSRQFFSEILGYSLMAALGISGEELRQ